MTILLILSCAVCLQAGILIGIVLASGIAAWQKRQTKLDPVMLDKMKAAAEAITAMNRKQTGQGPRGVM